MTSISMSNSTIWKEDVESLLTGILNIFTRVQMTWILALLGHRPSSIMRKSQKRIVCYYGA